MLGTTVLPDLCRPQHHCVHQASTEIPRVSALRLVLVTVPRGTTVVLVPHLQRRVPVLQVPSAPSWVSVAPLAADCATLATTASLGRKAPQLPHVPRASTVLSLVLVPPLAQAAVRRGRTAPRGRHPALHSRVQQVDMAPVKAWTHPAATGHVRRATTALRAPCRPQPVHARLASTETPRAAPQLLTARRVPLVGSALSRARR